MKNRERPNGNLKENKFFYPALIPLKKYSCVNKLFGFELIKEIFFFSFCMLCKSFINSASKHREFAFCKIFYNRYCLPCLLFSKPCFFYQFVNKFLHNILIGAKVIINQQALVHMAIKTAQYQQP